MQRLGLIGHPVAHSLSPFLHAILMQLAGIRNVQYELWDIVPDALAEKLDSLQQDTSILGANITVPHKKIVFDWLAARQQISDDVTKKLAATNTLYRLAASPNIFHGHNTDVLGAAQSLKHMCQAHTQIATSRIIILGNGGAVAPVEMAAACLPGARVQRLYRRDAANWARRDALLKTCDILINASSGGMVGAQPLEIDVSALPSHAAVWDIVYAPLETPLLQQARARHLFGFDGLHMLVWQAIESFYLWFPQTSKAVFADAFADIYAQCAAELQRRAMP